MLRRLVLTLAVLLVPAVSLAELCPKCQELIFAAVCGKCSKCGGMTPYASFKFCRACADKAGVCECCGVALKPAQPAIEPSAPATQAERIDPANGGTYKSDQWQYELTVTLKGTNSEGSVGRLLFAGKPVPDGTNVNDYYKTPWGSLFWAGQAKVAFGPHGWMPTKSNVAPVGKELPCPVAAAVEPDVWGEAVAGLQAALLPAKAVFAPGERMDFTLVVRNTTDSDITLANKGLPNAWALSFTSPPAAKNLARWQWTPVDENAKPQLPRLTVPAGKTVTLKLSAGMDKAFRFSWMGETDATPAPRAALPEGEWVVTASTSWPVPQSHVTLTTNEVTIEVVQKATSQPDAAAAARDQAIKAVQDFMIAWTQNQTNPATVKEIEILGVDDSGDCWTVRFRITPPAGHNKRTSHRVDKKTGQVTTEPLRM